MAKGILITRPNYDKITSYLHDFCKGVIDRAKAGGGVYIIDLEGNKAIRINLEKSINKDKPSLVFLNGHGNKRQVAGHKEEIILDIDNIHLMKDKIVYALSCDSLEDLGELSIDKGVKAYIGYKARFMLVIDPSWDTNPSKDKNALPFRRGCCALIESLIAGRTVKESIDFTKDEYLHSIRSYGTSEDDPYGDIPLIRFALAWNHEFLDMHGDPEAIFQ